MSLLDDIESRLERITGLLGRLNRELGHFRSCSPFVTKQDLKELEDSLTMTIQEATTALNALSTASDGLSIKVDRLVTATTALIEAVKAGGAVTPELEAAVRTAQAETADAAAAGDRVDAAIVAADEVLPTPAPPAPPN